MPTCRRWCLLFGPLLVASCVSSTNPAADAATDSAPVVAAVEIEYIAHAAFVIHAADGTSLLIDPYASRVWLGYEFPASYLTATAVLVTHPHYDHDYGEFIGQTVPWTAQQTVLRDPGSFVIGGASITGVAGKHADPYGQEFGQKNTIWIVEIDGVRIAHIGDNGPLTADVVSAMGRVDVLLAPIDGNEHILTYAQVDTIRAQLAPVILIPMHYRIDALETDPNSPDDLGPIEPWLQGKKNVDQVQGNRLAVTSGQLPTQPSIVVLQHASAVPPAP